MMGALVAGEGDPRVLAQMARTGLRRKIGRLGEAFTGYFTDHHASLLSTMLARVDAITADIARVDDKIEELISPFAHAVEQLDEITGIGRTAAQVGHRRDRR
jgi:transposase